MPVTVIVEPDPGGHRFQAVASVAQLAARTGDVVLLTSSGATASDEFRVYLSDLPIKAEEVFDRIYPPTAQMARAVAEQCRADEVATAIVMDADQSLKRWWYVARREFAGLSHRPRVVFMLTRYPAKLRLHDSFGWKLRVSKGMLALAAMATGTLHRVAGFAGREDMSRGWLVKRARDPAICTAHSRDRAALRAELGLPADRKLIGIFGVISERKNARLVFEAMRSAGIDGDLLLAGGVQPEVHAWLDALPASERERVIVFDGFLTNDLLDRLVAAVDVAPIPLTNNGPSGIMGKALAAGVPVVSAGSEVRARELRATGGGEIAELTEASIGAALRRVLDAGAGAIRPGRVPPATAEAFAAGLLGVEGDRRSPAGSLLVVNPRLRATVRAAVRTVNTPLAKARATRALAAAPRPLKLEIGGLVKRPGWVVTNVNAVARNYLDATAHWPLADGAVSHVYADNVIEHLPLAAGRALLAEAYRCLRPGGVIRLVTPDIRNHVEMYLAGSASLDSAAGRHYRDLGLVVEHPIDLVRIPIGSFGHHEGYVYDFDVLAHELRRAGFHSPVRCELGSSDHPELSGLDQRSDEGGAQIAVEAIR